MDLLEALAADAGVVCAVGAGGKKTTLYTLAAHATATGIRRTVVTATVRIPIFDHHVTHVAVTPDPVPAIERATTWPVGVVPEQDRPDRYAGYPPGVVDALATAEAADLVLIKADGARTREFKAPADNEPQLPRTADTVLPIASAHVVGKPLTSEYVHRPELVADLTGTALGEPVDADTVARVLASDDGGLKGVPPTATVVPVVNKVDNPQLQDTTADIANRILDQTSRVSRVVLARMASDDPLVAVID